MNREDQLMEELVRFITLFCLNLQVVLGLGIVGVSGDTGQDYDPVSQVGFALHKAEALCVLLEKDWSNADKARAVLLEAHLLPSGFGLQIDGGNSVALQKGGETV